jgi:hypothetical protein
VDEEHRKEGMKDVILCIDTYATTGHRRGARRKSWTGRNTFGFADTLNATGPSASFGYLSIRDRLRKGVVAKWKCSVHYTPATSAPTEGRFSLITSSVKTSR